MAIIKCPECGHEVSDMAQRCPFCGVDIAGNIITCPDCGKILLRTTKVCPNCSCDVSSTPAIPSTFINSMKTEGDTTVKNLPKGKKTGKRRENILKILIGVFIIGVAVGGYFYYQNMVFANQLNSDYEALAENYNIQDYNEFLKKYPESVYTQEIKKRISSLQETKTQWESIENSVSRNDFALFLKKYPRSFYTEICESRIDSLDWQNATEENTKESYTKYLQLHIQGKYVDLANKSIEDLDKLIASPTEKNTIRNLIHNYFNALANRNMDEMSEILTSKQYEQSVSLMNSLSGHTHYVVTSDIIVSRIPSKQTDLYNYIAKYQVERRSIENGNSVSELYRVSTIIYPNMRISIMRFNKVPAQTEE